MTTDPNPPRHIREILGQMSFIPTYPEPEPQTKECALCHCNFLSNPQWFGSQWHYPNICVNCGDNYSHRSEVLHPPPGKRPRTEPIECPGMKHFTCPGCHRSVSVQPVKDGAYWSYSGPCPHCGTNFVNLYHAYKAKPKDEEGEQPEKDKRRYNPSDD